MSNRRADVLIKYMEGLTMLGLNEQDERMLNVLSEIEKELELQQPKLEIIKDPSEALVIAIKDVSGSIGVWENHVFNEYYELALKQIQRQYRNVEEIFITHHTMAEKVLKDEFIGNGKNTQGGTLASSPLRKVIENLNIPKEVIVIQFSDGDNLSSDCTRVDGLLANDILPNVKYFKYIEANQYNRHSTLMEKCYKKVKNNNFDSLVIKKRDDALKGLRFGEELDGLQ